MNWLLLAMLVLLAACGGQGAIMQERHGQLVAADNAIKVESTCFTLRILEDGHGSASRIEQAWLEQVETETGAIEVQVRLRTAHTTALFFALDYDAGAFSPVCAAASGLLGDGDDVLELAVLSEPGTAYLGQVQVGERGRGVAAFTGEGVAARFVFAPGEFNAAKRTSRAPKGEWNEFYQWYDDSEEKHQWRYTNAGDYNQDSEVGIIDLASIASLIGLTTSEQKQDPRFFIVDGDNNGEVNQADIAVIAMNFGSTIAYYDVFTCNDSDKYPLDASAGAPDVRFIGRYTFEQAVVNEYSAQKYFIIDSGADLGYYVWIIPCDQNGVAGRVSLLRPKNYTPYLLWDPEAIAPTWWNGETNTVSWYMNLPGDCDQNTQVNIADLVPLRLQILTEGPFDFDSNLYVIDCNHDGIIDLDDQQVIVDHFSNTIAYYNIFTSDNVLDYPSCSVADSTVPEVARLDIADTQYTEKGRLFFSYTFHEGTLKRYVWVRPFCWSGEGTPGELIDTQAGG